LEQNKLLRDPAADFLKMGRNATTGLIASGETSYEYEPSLETSLLLEVEINGLFLK
jgi:hypothetical protein